MPGRPACRSPWQQNRQSRDGGAAHLAQQKHGGQGKGGQADIGHAAEVGGLAVAAHGPAGGYRHQSKADGGDDDAGDERREELGDLGEDGGDQQPDHRCAYHRTEHYRQPAFAIAGTHYRHDGGDACERHALYQWQLAAGSRRRVCRWSVAVWRRHRRTARRQSAGLYRQATGPRPGQLSAARRRCRHTWSARATDRRAGWSQGRGSRPRGAERWRSWENFSLLFLYGQFRHFVAILATALYTFLRAVVAANVATFPVMKNPLLPEKLHIRPVRGLA